jgi:hypothetical protein
VPTQEEIEAVRQRLRIDRPYYAEHCLKVVNEDGDIVPLIPRPAQHKLYAALREQRERGRPQRAIVLKSRKVGISTASQGMVIQDVTQNANRRALIVAQDNETAGELFDIADLMYANLPGEMKPSLRGRAAGTSRSGTRALAFGERARLEQMKGNYGLNSSLKIDTAKEVAAGRGKTIAYLHCSEVAWWDNPQKALGLLNAVPARTETVVILESTANGHNFFKKRWDAAVRGEGGFAHVFIGWTEDENCWREFDDPDERARFIETIGTGPWGEDEPRLIEQHHCTPEQLNWRRFTIPDQCEGKLEYFDQEYPSDAARAFVGSGKHVFSIFYTQLVIDRAEAHEQLEPGKGGPEVGVFKDTDTTKRKISDGEVEVPTAAMWVPRDATGFSVGHEFWRRWEAPITAEGEQAKPEPERQLPGQYIVAVDPAGGEGQTQEEGAYHGIEVIDHRTREQVAEYRGRRLDHDELARETLLAALAYNGAIVSVEVTGGYGYPVIRWLWSRGYRRIYRRRSADREEVMKTLGWDSNTRGKPLMEATFAQMLREGTHGIRSFALAHELTTYVVKPNGKHEPDDEAYSDLLMAYMQAQQVASETRLRLPDADSGPVYTWTGSNYGRL